MRVATKPLIASSLTSSAGGCTAIPSASSAGAAASASRRRGNSLPRHSSSAAPAARFTAIASAAVLRRPSHGSSTNPARNAPVAEPTVFTKYTSPTAGAAPSAPVCARVSRGKSAPSTNAGGNITAIATAICESCKRNADAPKFRTSAMKARGRCGSTDSETSESTPSTAMPTA